MKSNLDDIRHYDDILNRHYDDILNPLQTLEFKHWTSDMLYQLRHLNRWVVSLT